MSRFWDWLVDVWDWSRRMMGLDRVSRTRRAEDLPGRSMLGRILYFGRPALALLVILYIVALVARFSVINGDSLDYPQTVIVIGAPPRVPGIATEGAAPKTCAPSQIAAMTARIVDILVNENTWVPGDPQFKIGVFGLLSFEATPFLDNKASFQIGAIRAARRISIELTDLLGRARGTSAADPDLQDARGALQWNERAWIINPFDNRLQLISASAAASYRDAMERIDSYNTRLAACNALFDPRGDNLFQLLDRIANDIGGMSDQLAKRSEAERWEVATKTFVPAEGNNRGVFDFYADNLFHEARGMMWAYHGILQAARADFHDVIIQRNLAGVWDRMEEHIASAAALQPLIVSNGRDDSFAMPDHLAVMGVNMLRARANMTELRDILNR